VTARQSLPRWGNGPPIIPRNRGFAVTVAPHSSSGWIDKLMVFASIPNTL
jgi:hypothetical protein